MATSELNLAEALREAVDKLTAYSDSARIDAEMLLCECAGINRTQLYTHPEAQLPTPAYERLCTLVKKRQQGQPIAYLLGYKDFWSFRLKVSDDTLIPRPETELLVELVLSLLAEKSDAKILDLGTGSGAIALALATERPKWQLTASDLSEGALTIAQSNANMLSISNIQFLHSNWFSDIPKLRYDLIVSNPPYIAEDDTHLLAGDVRFEPRSALVSTAQGLQDIQHIIDTSPHFLKPQGHLLLEHGYQQSQSVIALMKAKGFSQLTDFKDINGLNRVAAGII